MIYPSNFETKTSFTEIRRMLSDYCICELGRQRVGEMTFLTDFEGISKQLDLTSEMIMILREGAAFPDQNYHDMRDSLAHIKVIGTWIEEQALLQLWRSLQTISDIINFLKDGERSVLYPNLCSLSDGVAVFPHIISAISHVLTKFGKIKDNASPELYRIRMDLANTQFSIGRILTGILKQAQQDGLVDKDAAPSMRDGRLVLPVAPAMKRRIKGIVHDESASGKTIFIEPEEVVEANNHIRSLEADEKREVIRILTNIADTIRPNIPDILNSNEFLADIDFIRAKARLSIDIEAEIPILEHKPMIDMVQAVHPLLKISHARNGRQIVPLDLRLDSKNSILLISGPNAGGKSVCLKTVGLLQYMLQCGLPVPMRSNSHVGIFKKIFIDIGDEQSIENDLSTYSSHLLNMKQMMKHCDRSSLILIDEFGSGTEPNIGGAIAEAILMRFNRSHTFGVITTHYQNLKNYAESNDGIINGAMLYDRHLMQPLYILQTGNPGSSFAVEIARKTGIPEDVISDASEIVGRDYINADKYLQDIVRDKRYWENKRQNVHQLEKNLDEQLARHERELDDLQKVRKAIISEAKEKADQMLRDSNAIIENTIRTIKESQADKELTRLARHELAEFQQTLDNIGMETNTESEDNIRRQMERIRQSQERRRRRKEEKARNTTPQSSLLSESNKAQPLANETFKPGDTVRLKGQTVVGTVTSVSRDNITVEFGNISTTVKSARLEHSEPVKASALNQSYTYVSRQTSEHISNTKLNFRSDIDVRGLRGDEAVQKVMHFIDDATLIGMSRVRILHGTGNGILRQLIRQYLATVPAIKSFQDEHIQFGGSGITVVDIG